MLFVSTAVKKVIRWERYLGVPDDLPTRFIVEDLDLQTKNGQVLSHHNSFAVKSEAVPTRLHIWFLEKNDGKDVPKG